MTMKTSLGGRMSELCPKCPRCGAEDSLRYHQATEEEWKFRIDEHHDVELVEIVDTYVDNKLGDPYIRCLSCEEEFDISEVLDD